MSDSAATLISDGDVPTADLSDLTNLANFIPQLAWMADGTGAIFWFNQRWLDYTGRTASEMRGRGWKAVHHPEHVDRVVAKYHEAFQSGMIWEDTFPLRRHDGEFRWFLSRAMPVRDDSGAIVRWYGTNTDVTDQRDVDERLRQSERRFRTLIDSAADIIWIANATGDFIAPQPAWRAFTGQTREEYGGWGWLEAVHPEDRAKAADLWAECVEHGRTFKTEYRLRHRDGEYRFTSVRAVPITESGQDIVEWVGINTDVSARKLAEIEAERARQSAEEANRAKSRFIANMSHELRTPLSAVIGYSEMLGEELQDLGHNDLIGDVSKIEASARHLLSLINDVLDLSKIEAGRMTVEVIAFDVRAMLDDVVASADALLAKKGNTLVLDLGPELGAMRSDEVKIRQCLLNLLSNAAKFTDKGTITLKVRRTGDAPDGTMVFEVSDNGIGMTAEQVSRLFQRFTQADESTTRQFGGTGLGLAITKAFCRKLGGDVLATSAFGEGSTFAMEILVEIQGDRDPDLHDAETVVRAAVHERSVLVVDDDPAARELLSRFLSREGFHVRTAADGKSGLTLARALRPQAVLLDVEMPRMDGWSVLHAIRSDPVIAETPVIMVSVVNEQSLGYSLGATGYLTKPVDWERLKTVMEPFHADGQVGTVLVIDDDLDARERLRIILARNGWTVHEAGNGQDALERLNAVKPDLILLDLMMPVMDGFAFLSTLRHRDDGRSIPVVVLTAKDVTAMERAQLEHQADRVIFKGEMRLAELAQQLRDLTLNGHKDGDGRGKV